MEKDAPLVLISELSAALEQAGVLYCHWKSNAALARSARGDNDLDLLVDRASIACFTEVLSRCGFKEVIAPSQTDMPGVLDYYGHDRASGKLVHVHAHYLLILGDDMTKNYHLPLERVFLGTSTKQGAFPVPAPELELLVFVIRMTLKHSTWDAVLTGHAYLSASERCELAYLQECADYEETLQLLRTHLPGIDVELFQQCLASLAPGGRLWLRARAAYRLQASLAACSRRPAAQDLALKLWRRMAGNLRRRARKRVPRKRLANGGAIIAVVGGDGAGKSTAISGLYSWLAKDFDVQQVHMGKPHWSALTIIVRGTLKLGRLLHLYPFVTAPVNYALDGSLDRSMQAFPGYPWLLRELCTARDRYLTYVKARRRANNGSLVICDRFPLPEVKVMDSPQVARMACNLPRTSLLRFCAGLEQRYYRPIALPELLVVLRADPQVSVARKTDEDPVAVRARAAEIWGIDWAQLPARVVDASRSKAGVLAELKEIVWTQL